MLVAAKDRRSANFLDKLKKLTRHGQAQEARLYHEISAVTGEGIEPLKYAIAELVTTHRGA